MSNIKFTVVLNGTEENKYEKMGLRYNPFPQIAEHGLSSWMLKVQSLEAPFPKNKTPAEHIRETLKGASEEFVEGMVARFQLGEIVRFDVEFTP